MVMGKKYYYENNVEVYSKVLAIGSSMMLDEYLTSLSYINNGEYFVEVVNDMCGKDSGISIVAKDFTAETFDMTKKDLTDILTFAEVEVRVKTVDMLQKDGMIDRLEERLKRTAKEVDARDETEIG